MGYDSLSILNEQLIGTGEGDKFITFYIDDEEFAIEVLKVQEIIGYTKPTPVPNLPDFVKGVINLRGAIIPIIDLRIKFNMPPKEYNKYTVIIIAEVATKTIGLIVDVVSDVLNITKESIQPIPEFSKIDTQYIQGMTRISEKLAVIINIERILNYEEYKQLNQI